MFGNSTQSIKTNVFYFHTPGSDKGIQDTEEREMKGTRIEQKRRGTEEKKRSGIEEKGSERRIIEEKRRRKKEELMRKEEGKQRNC